MCEDIKPEDLKAVLDVKQFLTELMDALECKMSKDLIYYLKESLIPYQEDAIMVFRMAAVLQVTSEELQCTGAEDLLMQRIEDGLSQIAFNVNGLRLELKQVRETMNEAKEVTEEIMGENTDD